ncbi:MAG: hypothetical protein JWM90_2517 [Thermoleophilia bacterium]|nr:hypothetical protein [Thermoleophilia bacterium]
MPRPDSQYTQSVTAVVEQLARITASLDAPASIVVPAETERFAAGKRSRIAAVAAILRPAAGDDLELLLIRRAERAGDVWSGQMALPGGRREPTDVDPVHTAQRETAEEVGIDLTVADARLLGALPSLLPMNPALPPISVYPFVWSVDDAEASLSEEVADFQWVPLAHLRSIDNRIEHRLSLPDGVERSFPAIALGDDVLWGMTHRIVHTLLDAAAADE